MIFSPLRPVLLCMLLLLAWLNAWAEPYQWRNVAVGAGGFAPGIIYSRSQPGLAYLRTDMGGIYRWDEAQQRWLPLQDAMAESSYFGVESIALDPQHPERVYAAVGMYQGNPAAILRSHNYGKRWDIIPVDFPMGGNEDGRGLGERLAVDPHNAKHLLFGSRHHGLQRSLDGGSHWQPLASFPHPGLGLPQNPRSTHAGISFVVFDPQRQGHIYVGLADPAEQHLYMSRDGGTSWQAIPHQPAPQLLPVKAELDDRGVLYIAYSTGIGPNGIMGGAVYRWDSRAAKPQQAWRNITPDQSAKPAAGGYMGLSLDRQNPGTLVVATINRWQPYDTLWRSTDDGATWADLYPRSEQDVSSTPFLLWGQAKADFGWWMAGLAINPFNSRELVYTTGATVYRSQLPPSATGKIIWRPWDKGIEQTAIITLNSLPQGAEVLSGFGDISGFYHDDLSQSPRIMYTNPVFANTNNIDYAGANPRIVVRSGTPPHRSHGPVPTLAWSHNSGKDWQPLASPVDDQALGLSQADRDYVLAGNAAIISSADGASFVVMSETPVISHNRGTSWQRIQGLPRWGRPVADRVNPQVFYALDFASSQLYLSRDQGKSFQRINSRGLPGGLANDQPRWREHPWPLHATPGHEGDLWLVSAQGLFHSRDSGQRFHAIDTAIHIQQLSFGKAAAGSSYPTVFAIATHQGKRGIYRSTDQGNSWQLLNDSQHQYGQRFRTLSGDPKHFGRVYVGTDGRGIVYGEPVGEK